MDSKWNITKLIAVASLGVLSIILQMLGGSLTTMTGIPLMSAVINIFIAPAIIMICLLVVRTTGAATIMYLIISVLSLPLPVGGAPGFLPKIPIAIVEGIIADVLFYFLKQNEKVASLIIGAATMIYAGIATVELGRIFELPGIEQTANLIYSPLIIAIAVAAAVGGILGYFVYSRIKDTDVVNRIQS